MSALSSLELSCCSFALCDAVLNPEAARPDTIFPEGRNYEITQIFLDRIQGHLIADNGRELLDVETRDKLDHYLSYHFPNAAHPSDRQFPVEVLWAAFGLCEKNQKSPWATFYCPITNKPLPHTTQLAESLYNLVQDVLKTPQNEEVSEKIKATFPALFSGFVHLLQEEAVASPVPCLPLHQKGSKSFPKFYNVADLNAYYKTHQRKEIRRAYSSCFKALENLFSDNPEKQTQSDKFLQEWKSMKPIVKHNARNHDPFVKQFQQIFDGLQPA